MRMDQASPRYADTPPGVSPEPTHRSRRSWLPVVIGLAIALVAAIAVGSVWRSDLRDAERTRDVAVREVGVLTARVDRLEQQLGSEVPGLESRLEAARIALREARADLTALAGPALADGRHFVQVVAVGDEQDPPRLLVDVQQWFTDQAAVDAALEDGVHPAEAGINGYYIRNENPRWRAVWVDPEAPVALTMYPYGQIDDPTIVDLARFGSLIESTSEELRVPYWITVRDGVVVRIDEQYLP